MTRLAHISDIHLAPLPSVKPRELLNKRITGYVNWRIKRAKYMQRDTLLRLVEHMKGQNAHFTAVTGDLVNLSLTAEFENARNWLKTVGPPEKVCAIPGNHDVYVSGALESFRQNIGAYGTGELIDEAPFPFVRRVGDVAIIGCSSAVVRPPFIASGEFYPEQAERLRQCLDLLGKAEFFRVVLIHHPPSGEASENRAKGLRGAYRFRSVIKEAGAELVLHGHTHKSSVNEIDGPSRPVPVIGVAAASASASHGEDPARYNLFDIERVGDRWSCSLREYGYQRIGDDIVLRLQMRIC